MFLSSVTSRVAVLSVAAASAAFALLAACSSDDAKGGGTTGTEGGAADTSVEAAEVPDAGEDAALTGKCSATFGTALTDGFGRIDGVVYAVQKPSDVDCAMADKSHVVVQVLMEGAVYRLVVNLESDVGGADPKIRFVTFPHAMPAPEYAEGWRTGVPLDYANLLGAHSGDAGFAPLTPAEAATKIAAEVKVGDAISVYAVSTPGQSSSAELVHRNDPGKNEDGAIVVGPTSATPKFLLFHFADQTF